MRIGLVVNRAKPLARRFVPGLCRWLRSRGHEPVLATSTARAFKVDVESMPSARLVHRVDLVVASAATAPCSAPRGSSARARSR